MTEQKKESLTQEQQAKAVKWLQDKWKDGMCCEVCGEKNWDIKDSLVTPILFRQDSLYFGTVYPSLSVSCKNCANTKYFDAVKIGLIEKNLKKE
jgi:hypothetical protein